MDGDRSGFIRNQTWTCYLCYVSKVGTVACCIKLMQVHILAHLQEINYEANAISSGQPEDNTKTLVVTSWDVMKILPAPNGLGRFRLSHVQMILQRGGFMSKILALTLLWKI